MTAANSFVVILGAAAYVVNSRFVIGYIRARQGPDCLRSDNGSQPVARALKQWLDKRGDQTNYIAPVSRHVLPTRQVALPLVIHPGNCGMLWMGGEVCRTIWCPEVAGFAI